MKNQNNTVILARVSGKSQEDGYSLDSQMKLLTGYCENKGYTLKKTFKIIETASKANNRTTFNEMLKYLKQHNIQHLIVEKTDRFTRNLKDAVIIDEWLNANPDRYLHAVKEGLLLHKNAKSDVKFMWNIHVAVAKKYTDNLREEVMKGCAEKLAQGWSPAPPPTGYMSAMRDGRKIHVPDPKAAKWVKKSFRLYIEEGENVRTIGNFLDAMGVKTRNGRTLSKSNVHKMLTNPYYMGIIRFSGETYPGAHKPLISEELFQQVQDKLHDRAPKKKTTHNYVLKGMLSCVYCERTITWQKQKSHLYGGCQRKLESCKNKKFIREDKVQEELFHLMSELVCPSDEIMNWLVDTIELEYGQSVDKHEDVIENINKQIARIESMDDALYDDKLAGVIAAEKYTKKHEEFLKRIKELRSGLETVEDVSKDRHDESISILKLSQHAANTYGEIEDNDEKRSILTKLFKSMVVGDNSVSVRYTKLAQVIARCSAESREIMNTLKAPNQTNKKDPRNRGLSEQQAALRSVWCA